jgi:ferric-dicitrate binding protein FerR (iron transport regulator)
MMDERLGDQLQKFREETEAVSAHMARLQFEQVVLVVERRSNERRRGIALLGHLTWVAALAAVAIWAGASGALQKGEDAMVGSLLMGAP